jgi:hypothetical protein
MLLGPKESPRRRQVELSSTNVQTRPRELNRPRGEAIDLPPYKDVMGRWRTDSLFVETISPLARDDSGEQRFQKYTPMFTLREHDIRVDKNSPWYERYSDKMIPSLRRIYLEYNDPTEFKFAMEVFASTYHWKHLCGLSWFKPHVEEYRRTLAEKLRGIGIDHLVRIAEGTDPKFALQAAKWLAEGSFESKGGKGRPSKIEVASQMRRELDIEKIYRDDAARLGLEVTTQESTPAPDLEEATHE